MNSLPLFSQELPTSCIPACMRMVLAQLGFQLTEAQIRQRCRFSRVGLSLKQAINGFQDLPVLVEHHSDWSIDDIIDSLRIAVFPVVGVDLRLIEGFHSLHAVVVSKITREEVVVHDPLIKHQPRRFSLSVFDASWKSAGSEVLTIQTRST